MILGLAGLLGVFLLSFFTGNLINIVVDRLPRLLQRNWRLEAQRVLKASASVAAEPVNNWRPTRARRVFAQVACGLLATLILNQYGMGWQALAMVVLSWSLLALSLIDLDHRLLPDALVLPLLWLGLIANSFNLFTTLPEALWGVIVGYLSLWSVYWLFRLCAGREGLGYGDFKLVAMLGAWGGWQILPIVLFIASSIGVVACLIKRCFGRSGTDMEIAFGPCIASAGLVAMLWGKKLISMYFG